MQPGLPRCGVVLVSALLGLKGLRHHQKRRPVRNMARHLVYTTFQEGELERELRRLSRKGGPVNDAPPGWKAERRHRFHHKWHECPVTFPDGSAGTCHYTRHGPACHGFRYQRENEYLPHVNVLEALGRDAGSIEELAQEKAAVAFGQAIAEERKVAMRAQPPWNGYGKRKADPALYTLSRERAVQLAGRYALCARLEPSVKRRLDLSHFAA
jgi:hypothetical protein